MLNISNTYVNTKIYEYLYLPWIRKEKEMFNGICVHFYDIQPSFILNIFIILLERGKEIIDMSNVH